MAEPAAVNHLVMGRPGRRGEYPAAASQARARPRWRWSENAYQVSSSPGQRSGRSLKRRKASRPEMAIDSRSARSRSEIPSMKSSMSR